MAVSFGYTIIYVQDVKATVEFYSNAFGLGMRFMHESGEYAEMETGSTVLAFASDSLANGNGVSYRPNSASTPSAGFEIALVTEDPESVHRHAIEAGASSVSEPTEKPWGQIVAYVTDINGCLVELCTPMGTP